ncbi:MAG: PAS domain S-box protein [Nitrospirae bacterium]|nr:PAS domain S-box protein [Nitrospirota bacterium]
MMKNNAETEALRLQIEKLEKEIEALRKSEEKYKSIFNAVPVSIQITDEEGTITEINPFHVDHIGKGRTTKDDYLQQNILTRKSIVQSGLSQKYEDVLHGGTMDEGDIYFPSTTGGTDAYYNVRGVPLRLHGNLSGAVFIIEDVTTLKIVQDTLMRHRDKLEEIVEARTRDLTVAYEQLRQENDRRKKTEAEKEALIQQLQEALKQVKTLRGFLPICSSCKKIRDDRGYWNQIESYIKEHSEAEFSHSICPACARKLYPDIL